MNIRVERSNGSEDMDIMGNMQELEGRRGESNEEWRGGE